MLLGSAKYTSTSTSTAGAHLFAFIVEILTVYTGFQGFETLQVICYLAEVIIAVGRGRFQGVWGLQPSAFHIKYVYEMLGGVGYSSGNSWI